MILEFMSEVGTARHTEQVALPGEATQREIADAYEVWDAGLTRGGGTRPIEGAPFVAVK